MGCIHIFMKTSSGLRRMELGTGVRWENHVNWVETLSANKVAQVKLYEIMVRISWSEGYEL